ncbi:MAG TPA: ATP-binding cassette domain-containing protein [Polyangia bacterium]|nr:ATP-binding cassette domain-containing protein [Polyangia bacterium]
MATHTEQRRTGTGKGTGTGTGTGSGTGRGRLLVPETLQTSAMDCGPAALKSLLGGFGVSISYGRLREACQTTVDGTSIDALESIAAQLGLDAGQTLLPLDHLLLPEAEALPAILVVRKPGGLTHFVLVWSRHGRYVQVMDPAVGRQWLPASTLLASAYVHSTPVPSAAWREWAGSPGFLLPLEHRLGRLGLRDRGALHIGRALADPSWRSLGLLDAATRMVTGVLKARGVRRGPEAARLLAILLERSAEESAAVAWERPTIPKLFWSVRPMAPERDDAPTRPDAETRIHLRGAVLLTARGLDPEDARARTPRRLAVHLAGDLAHPLSDGEAHETRAIDMSTPELRAALAEAPIHPARELFRLLRAHGRRLLVVLLGGLLLSAGGLVAEAVLFRGVFDLRRDLSLPEQRLGALVALAIFGLLLLLLEGSTLSAGQWLGRQLEVRWRVAFLAKLSRLRDQYLQSRPSSDMAERCHSVHRLRTFPPTAGQFVLAAFELVLTTAAILWLAPERKWLALAAMATAVLVPILAQGPTAELDLRVRTHAGSLGRFYLDAMLGLVAVRAHSAERAVRREHETLLTEWARASYKLLHGTTAAEAIGALSTLGLVGWLFASHIAHLGIQPRSILLLYWLFQLPAAGRQIASLARLYPLQRNVALRLLEPFGAPEQDDAPEPQHVPEPQGDAIAAMTITRTAPEALVPASAEPRPPAIRFEGVQVRAGGHVLLDEINLDIAAGEHLAIVGPSGAGKSSLVGLLLGWHHPSAGAVYVDRQRLDERLLAELRQDTAWVDPSIQLWNRSVLDNLTYGIDERAQAPGLTATRSASAVRDAQLGPMLKNMPSGLQTSLGEGGALASGGEGQRVRLGRALVQERPRLVILDEPFRGLDRRQRRQLLELVRARWQGSTLLCVTHDLGETLAFDRVLVVEGGRIVEDASPHTLVAHEDTRYRALLATEAAVRETTWSGTDWRRLRIQQGQLLDGGTGGPP